MKVSLDIPDEECMRKLAAKIAEAALKTDGLFIALYGNMGAGKTTFVRGVGEFFGIDDVKSPTFTVIDEHDNILHIDAYRLDSADELYDMGYEDYIGKKKITVVEWPEKVKQILPEDRLEITITGQGEGARSVLLTPLGNTQSVIEGAF